MRPESIQWFERVYIGEIILSIGMNIYSLYWTASHLTGGASANTSLVWSLELLILLVFNLLLLYFIAHRASRVAKWVFVVSTALVLIPIVRTVIAPNFLPALLKMGPLFGVGLDFTMIMLLFQPDSRDWFARRGVVDEDYIDTFS